MVIEESLVAALELWAPLAESRVFPLRIESGTPLPSICVIRIGGIPRDEHLLGISGLCRTEFQIDCWAWSYADVKALAREVRLGIVRHPRQTALVQDGPRVGGMRLEDDTDDYSLSGEAYRVIMRVHVTHTEEI